MSGFAQKLVSTQAKGYSKMAYCSLIKPWSKVEFAVHVIAYILLML